MNPLIASMLNQAVQHYQGGNLDRAEAVLKQVLQIHSRDFDALHLFGIVKGMKGDHAGAMSLFKKAVAINPNDGFVQFNLAKALSESGDDAGALQHHVKATRLAPDQPDIWVNYGRSLANLGRHEDAVAAYRKALGIHPDHVEALANLGESLLQLGRLDESVACQTRALQLNPNLAEVWSNLGAVLNESKRYGEALAAFDRSLALVPGYGKTWFNKSLSLNQLKRYEEALATLDQALSLSPDHAESWSAKAYALNELWRFGPAQAASEKAVALKPDLAAAWANLGRAVHQQGMPTQAIEHYRKALALNPDLPDVHTNLGNAAQDRGRLDEALSHYARALSIKPDYAQVHSNRLFVHAYYATCGKQEYLAQARTWDRACLDGAARETARARTFRNPPLAGRRLRVGYVSGDFRQHAVSFFIENLLRYHDRGKVELFAYSVSSLEDAATARLRPLADHWAAVAGASDMELRDRIEADGIDVLIDLSGHTATARLEIFAHRAAPVQAHYLGYFASTGLTEMDYWIGDDIVTPAAADADFSERIWRLPRVWVAYLGREEAPAPDWRPRGDGTVLLGSFNDLRKLTPPTLAMWARVLRALPEGRLLLKNRDLGNPENRERVLQALEAGDVQRERVELMDANTTPGWAAHMACYNRLDVALDPVGAVGGGTTTCDALWMGVPVVTLEGDRMASRMTASMLHAVGHAEWIARSEAEYIGKIVELARNPQRRAALGATLRAQMAASPLGDVRGLAAQLEAAYAAMFDRWVDNNENR